VRVLKFFHFWERVSGRRINLNLQQPTEIDSDGQDVDRVASIKRRSAAVS